MVKQIYHVKTEDVKIFLKDFAINKRDMVENILTMKRQNETQKQEIQRKNMEIKQKEDQLKMQSFVLSKVTDYFKNLQSSELQELKENKALHRNKLCETMDYLKEQEILIDHTKVEQFITETFFASDTEIEKFINEKLLEENLKQQANKTKDLQLDHSNQRLSEKLSKAIHNFIENRSETKLNTPKSCLQRKQMHDFKDIISNFAQDFSRNLRKDMQKDKRDLTLLIESYSLNNKDFVESSITTSINMSETKRKMDEQNKQNEMR